MSTAQLTGATRPGGRTARTRAAVHEATLALLAEGRFDELSLRAVAERSGVHLSSLYRRWGSLPALLVDVLLATSEAEVAAPDCGTFSADLLALARDVAAFHATGPGLALLHLAARPDLPGVPEVRARFWAARLERFGPMVARARLRGELSPDVNPLIALQLVIAPIHQRLLLSGLPVDDPFLVAVVNTVVRGLGGPHATLVHR